MNVHFIVDQLEKYAYYNEKKTVTVIGHGIGTPTIKGGRVYIDLSTGDYYLHDSQWKLIGNLFEDISKEIEK